MRAHPTPADAPGAAIDWNIARKDAEEVQVKIFTHIGSDTTEALEKQINEWLALLPAHGEMRHTSTAITITDGKPSFIVAIWWQPHNGNLE
jgi:hypothetical protein